MSPRVELHVGMSGSGKTVELNEQVREAVLDEGERGVYVDTAGDDGAALFGELVEERDLWCYCADSIPVVRQRLAQGAHFVLYQPARDRELGPPARGEIPDVEHLASICLDMRDVFLAITEVHMHVPEAAPIGRQTRTLLTQYRHYGCSILADTQRFAAVAKPLVSQASALRLFAMAGEADLKVVQDIGGRPLRAAVEEAARRMEAGEPGYHVAIDARHPPVRPKLRRRDLDG